jgi:hypothetical protein
MEENEKINLNELLEKDKAAVVHNFLSGSSQDPNIIKLEYLI